LATVFVLAAAVKLAGVPGLTPHMPRTSPEKLDALPGHARVLNEYGFGGWLIWTARDVSPGIDGRSEIYSPSYVSGYFAALGMQPGWKQFVAKHSFEAAWLHKSTPLTLGLRSLGWRTVWHEGDTLILVPPTLPAAALISG
jgi:hypothetical protein